ncbi:hypothetical protein ACIGGE_16255 [Qipengyuania sp. NPDC077410]|uniref:terminase small subunit-like protein n=1 Tax=Qipengyuania sp. NPDC077410 TaxID=3364496 RepID=UPI0037C64FB1
MILILVKPNKINGGHMPRRQLTNRQKTDTAKKYSKVEKMQKLIKQMADENLSPTDRWKLLGPEMKAIILYRCHGGETVKSVCRDLGLEPATVYMAAFKDKEGFGADLKDAREHGQHALADMMLDLPYDKTMSASDKRLAFDAAKYLTKTRNRAEYGDKVELSGQIDTNVALPNWAFGQVIDATPQPEQLTDQSLDTGVPLDVDVVEEQPAHKPK